MYTSYHRHHHSNQILLRAEKVQPSEGRKPKKKIGAKKKKMLALKSGIKQ